MSFQFFDDTITYLKGGRVPFLSKYQESVGPSQVVPLRDFMIEIIQVGLRKSSPASTLDVLKEGVYNYVQEHQIVLDNKMIEILSICIFSRREELRRVFTELIFQKSVDKHLVDYNYNIEICMASESFSKVNEAYLVLELMLRGQDGKGLERVVIELNNQEAKAFVGKLREIEKVINSQKLNKLYKQELIGSSQ
ncbi:UNKNOWN [Stylonychia lemnae]|uniref:COMM domain-containing protein n=1 Tax=Stylonychia lemnae TaxID=5949 RepID=A0A078ARW3_STYLE|nr:UNKNOWN [Stylonychia lemnae]|eukprot:CDW83623.1 UNKNOWN [Stylonychia lemnae]